MTQVKTLFVLLFAFNMLNANAQIAKGNYSLGGTAGIFASGQKSDLFQATAATISLNPSINKFITDKWLVGCQPNLGVATGKSEFKDFFGVDQGSVTLNTQTLGLGVNTRYYFAEAQKAQFFGALGLAYEKRWYSSSFNSLNTLDTRGSNATFNYDVGIGASIFVNPEIAFESIISYQKEEQNSTFTVSGNSSSFKGESVSLDFKFNNFVNLSSKKNEEGETPQYVKKGRRIVGGQAYLGRGKFEDSKEWQTGYSLNPVFGQFVTNNFLLKGEISLSGNFESKGDLLNSAISGRYYFSINKKFYIYPELNIGYLKSYDRSNNSSPNNGVVTYGGGFGASYFLSNNVAIDATLFSVQKSNGAFNNVNGVIGAQNLRLLYYIR